MRVAAALVLTLLTAAAGARPALAQTQASHEDVNAANNPLTPKITVNFHDQWAPELYDLDEGSNAFLFRGVIPHRLGGTPQLFRYTLPVVTAPDGAGGTHTGLGDLNLIELFPFVLEQARMEVAVGPQITLPTASNDFTGTGKWQAGFAVLAIAPRKFGIAGALVTWQRSFAGDADRPTQNGLSIQPLFIYNLPKGWYLRSTGTWNFAFAQDTFAIPLGAGAGKVMVLQSGVTVNVFAEPQFTIGHDGAGQPKFQMFMGLNLQFPLGRP